MVFTLGAFLLIKETYRRVFESGNVSGKPHSSTKIRRTALRHMTISFTLAGLARFRIKSGISNELWHRRKFLNIAANLGENDSGKSSAHARNRLKFGIKIIHDSSNLFVKSGD